MRWQHLVRQSTTNLFTFGAVALMTYMFRNYRNWFEYFFKMDDPLSKWSAHAKDYDPLKAGSIDGTDTEPHDKAISRAMNAHYEPPYGLKSKPEKTLFVSRFGPRVTKDDLIEFFSQYGEVVSAKVIYDVVTGHSQNYGFVEMKNEKDAWKLARKEDHLVLYNHKLFVDFEVCRTMKGWIPRRLGGGFGGKKESGQLRFGGKERPFKKPFLIDVPPNMRKQ